MKVAMNCSKCNTAKGVGDPISKMNDAYFKHPEDYPVFKRYVNGVLIDDKYDKVDIEFVVDKVSRSGSVRLMEKKRGVMVND